METGATWEERGAIWVEIDKTRVKLDKKCSFSSLPHVVKRLVIVSTRSPALYTTVVGHTCHIRYISYTSYMSGNRSHMGGNGSNNGGNG